MRVLAPREEEIKRALIALCASRLPPHSAESQALAALAAAGKCRRGMVSDGQAARLVALAAASAESPAAPQATRLQALQARRRPAASHTRPTRHQFCQT